MTARVAIAFVVATGCIEDATPAAERDVAEVENLLDAIDVTRTVALATDPEGTLQLDDGCRVDFSQAPAPLVDSVTHTRWEGPCLLADGALLEGSLTHTESADGLVLSADSFRITGTDALEVVLSGAIELHRVDHLLEVELSLQACGPVGPGCDSAQSDSALGLDLDYSIYPMDTFPQAYSVSVSGAVDGEDRFVSVEGAWQTDTTDCATEPARGSVVLGTLPRQTLTLDGEDACDGCVAWQVEGIEVAPLCDADAW